jgi:hypothetical protein
MAKRKSYKITVRTHYWFDRFLRELRGWGVSPNVYHINDETLTVTTKNLNVVDVATETFMHEPLTVSIEKV